MRFGSGKGGHVELTTVWVQKFQTIFEQWLWETQRLPSIDDRREIYYSMYWGFSWIVISIRFPPFCDVLKAKLHVPTYHQEKYRRVKLSNKKISSSAARFINQLPWDRDRDAVPLPTLGRFNNLAMLQNHFDYSFVLQNQSP